jgi:hypothetical protein
MPTTRVCVRQGCDAETLPTPAMTCDVCGNLTQLAPPPTTRPEVPPNTPPTPRRRTAATAARTHELSEQFVLPFARLSRPTGEDIATYTPLDTRFRRTDRSFEFVASPGEETVRRYLGTCIAAGAINDRGEPPGCGDEPFYFTPLAMGAAEIVLTDRRIVFLFVGATSVIGTVNVRQGQFLVMVMAHEVIEAVSTDRRVGITGRLKEYSVQMGSYSRVGTVKIESIHLVEGKGGWVRHRGGFTSFANDVVAAACRARLADPALDPIERDVLERAERGERTLDGQDIVARLAV